MKPWRAASKAGCSTSCSTPICSGWAKLTADKRRKSSKPDEAASTRFLMAHITPVQDGVSGRHTPHATASLRGGMWVHGESRSGIVGDVLTSYLGEAVLDHFLDQGSVASLDWKSTRLYTSYQNIK